MDVKRLKIPIEKSSLKRVEEAIVSGELAYGKSLAILEKTLTQLFNRKYCVLTSNGFSSVLLSIQSLGLKNENILVPAISSCFSFVNAIKATGNIPVFCDVELNSGNICLKSAAKVFKEKVVSAIVSPNHIGVLSHVDELAKFNVPIIEDCAQSFLSSSEVKSKSNFQVFSFFPTKIANGIDGGAILLDDEHTYLKLKDLVYYDHQLSDDGIVRYNFKMQNINAAYLLGTLEHFDSYKIKIKTFQLKYTNSIKKLTSIKILSENTSFLFRYMIQFNSEKASKSFMNKNLLSGISREFMFLTNNHNHFLNSISLVYNSCSLPFYLDLKLEEIELVIERIKETYEDN